MPTVDEVAVKRKDLSLKLPPPQAKGECVLSTEDKFFCTRCSETVLSRKN